MSDMNHRETETGAPGEQLEPAIPPGSLRQPPAHDLGNAYILALFFGILVDGIIAGGAWLLGEPVEAIKRAFYVASVLFVILAPIVLMGPLDLLLVALARRKWSAEFVSRVHQVVSGRREGRIRLPLAVRQVPSAYGLSPRVGIGIQTFSDGDWETLVAVELGPQELSRFGGLVRIFGQALAQAPFSVREIEFAFSWAIGESVVFAAARPEEVILEGFPKDALKFLDRHLELLVSGLGVRQWVGGNMMALATQMVQKVRAAIPGGAAVPGRPSGAQAVPRSAPAIQGVSAEGQGAMTPPGAIEKAQRALVAMRCVALARHRRWTKAASVPTFETVVEPLVLVSLHRTVYRRGRGSGPIVVEVGLGVWSYLGFGENIWDYGFDDFFGDSHMKEERFEVLAPVFASLAERVPPEEWTWYLVVEVKDENTNDWWLWVRPLKEFKGDVLPEEVDARTRRVHGHLMALLEEVVHPGPESS